jgi:energy-converting hydrogenase Eha subunit A
MQLQTPTAFPTPVHAEGIDLLLIRATTEPLFYLITISTEQRIYVTSLYVKQHLLVNLP